MLDYVGSTWYYLVTIALLVAVVYSLFRKKTLGPRLDRRAMHVMVDLETLSVEPNAYIRTIGAAVFNRSGLVSRFHESCDGAEQVGADINDETIDWWTHQSAIAKRSLENHRQNTLKSALESFARWLEEERRHHEETHGEAYVCIWGNGAAFDPVVLENAFKREGLPLPWKFYNVRCYRTLKALYKNVPAPKFEGEPHVALDDAIHEARHAAAILDYIGS